MSNERSTGLATRREALAGALACTCAAAAHASGTARPVKPWRVDVHHHYGSQALNRFAELYPESGLAPAPANSLARSLEDMDRAGVQTTLLSSFAPSEGGTPASRRAFVRSVNETGAAAVAQNPKRFALFAALPLPDIDGSLSELAYGLDVLRAIGVTVYSEAAGKYLGDPLFAPLLEELDRRKAVVFVHPKTDQCCRNVVPDVPDTVIEYGTSTTRTIASILFNGVVDRYPNVKFIFSHGGGTMPFLIERFLPRSSAELSPGIVTQIQGGPPLKAPRIGTLAALRSFHYDTAQISNPVALRALAQVATPKRILLGSDAWFRSTSETVANLETAAVFSAGELKAIERENVLRLLPGLSAKG